jgi:hypothetical protein
MTVVEGEGEFSVAELEAFLYLIELNALEWLKTLDMGRKVRFPLGEKLIVPLNLDRLQELVSFEGNEG